MTGNGQDYDGPILECKNLCISYFTRAGEIPAVIDFDLTLRHGDSVGLVGESGCGKSTVAMAISLPRSWRSSSSLKSARSRPL